MVWTTPMTAVADTALTAAQWNIHVRDNLNMTGPAVATGSGGIICTSGANAVVQRTPANHTVTTSQGTTSTSYTNLATTGPTIQVTTGTKAIVMINSAMNNGTNGASSFASFEVTGATTIAANDQWALLCEHDSSSVDDLRYGSSRMVTTLNAGSNTFTMKYKVGAGTGNFSNREIIVIPL